MTFRDPFAHRPALPGWLLAAAVAVAALLLLAGRPTPASPPADPAPAATPAPHDCPAPDCVRLLGRGGIYGEITPVMDLPRELREKNWGGGSCVHASTVMLLRWQGQHDMAEWWRRTYSGGEYADRLHKRLDKAGVKFAATTRGDAQFLEWAARTRRGAGITFWPRHAVCLVHLDEQRAGILDNNRVDKIIWIERHEFLRRWKEYGGWAWTPVYQPPPPPAYLGDLAER